MTPLPPVHVIGRLIGIATGFVALLALKGAPLHRKSGVVFVYPMLAMSASGAVMELFSRGNLMGGALTLCLVTLMLYWVVCVRFTQWQPRRREQALTKNSSHTSAAIVEVVE